MTTTKFTAHPSVTHTETPKPACPQGDRPKPAGDATFAVLHDRRIAYGAPRKRSGVPARSQDRRQPDRLGAGHGTARRNRSACDHRGPARSRPVDPGPRRLLPRCDGLSSARPPRHYLGHRQAILVGHSSVVASRCSSPTSFQNAATDSCSSAVVASAPRDAKVAACSNAAGSRLSSRQSEVKTTNSLLWGCRRVGTCWHRATTCEPTDGGEVVGVRDSRRS